MPPTSQPRIGPAAGVAIMPTGVPMAIIRTIQPAQPIRVQRSQGNPRLEAGKGIADRRVAGAQFEGLADRLLD